MLLVNKIVSQAVFNRRPCTAQHKLSTMLSAALFLQSQAKLTGVESQVNAVVASVFSERYRDVVEDVRVCCIKELGTWIKEYK